MAVAVSFINMKGGVGKTTVASQLAHAADQQGLKVLAVDLDPQSNLSHSLLGVEEYVNHVRDNRPTIVQVFEDYIPPSGTDGAPGPIALGDIALRGIGYSRDSSLDLIPSRLELSRTLKNPTGKERRLAKGLAKISGRYDLILIDCAPTESILTDAAYFASRYVVVPVKPEFMATVGLPLLARSIREFNLENEDQDLDIAGLVINEQSEYADNNEKRRATEEINNIAQEYRWRIFQHQLQYSRTFAEAARQGLPLSRTPHARGYRVEALNNLRDEIFSALGISK